MQYERVLTSFRRKVNLARRASSRPDSGMEADEYFDSLETVQHILEAVMIDGATLKNFAKNMLNETNCASLPALAIEYGRQDTPQLEEE